MKKPAKAGSCAPSHKRYHADPTADRPISAVYPVIDTDLGRDNVENDLTAADIQDLM